MENFNNAYKEYSAFATQYNEFWLNYSINEHTENEVRPSMEELIDKTKIAANALHKETQKRDINYDEYVDSEIRKAAEEGDSIKLSFLVILIVEFPPQNIINGICYAIEHLIKRYNDSLKLNLTNRNEYLIEQLIDLLWDYPETTIIPTLEKVCQIDPQQKEFSIIIECITKALGILSQLKEKRVYDIYKRALNHSHIEVREEAELQIDSFKDEGLVNTNGDWIGN